MFDKRGFIINWKALEKQSLSETINALAMASPFSLEEKQVLLEAKNLDDEWSVIHAEVYVSPNAGDFRTAPVISAFGLSFEPSLIVADSNGIITEIVHLAMDKNEISAALKTVN